MSTSTKVDQVYEGVKEMLEDKQIELSELVIILAPTMELIERLDEDKSGIEKKNVLLTVFKRIINNSNLEDEKKKNLLYGCNHVIPSMVDTIISASRGDLDLNVNINQINSCLDCFRKKKR